MCFMSIQLSINRATASLQEKQSQLSLIYQCTNGARKLSRGPKSQVTVTNHN